MKRLLSILAFAMLFCTSYGQNIIRHDFNEAGELDEKIEFDNKSSDYKIILDVDSPLSHIDFAFTSLIDEGGLVIEIIDPNGKHEGGFELEGHSESKGAFVNGDMTKRIMNPLYGEWTVKISLAQAEGFVSVSATSKKRQD